MLSEQSKTVNNGRRSKPSVWECSEVIFRDAEKRRQADISHPKTSLHSKVETIRSRWSQIGKFYRISDSRKHSVCRQADDNIKDSK